MKSKSWLAIPALAVAGISWYYYTCHIRCSCSSAASPPVVNTVTEAAKEPVEFTHGKNYPVTGSRWTAYRDSLVALAKAGKIIEVTGFYSSAEINNTRYENLGLARADTIKDLLVPDIPASQIVLRSSQRDGMNDTVNSFVSSIISASDPVKAPSADGGVVQKDEKTALIYFPSGSAKKELDKAVDDYLISLAAKLKASNGSAIITGHTDNKGKFESNMGLSKSRAEQVKAILAGHGADATKLSTNGMADKEPIGDNNTEEGRRLNRRVEIKIQ
jgi:outer membrane protein OmpA-like peptidoglycan-associated protein